MVICSSAFATLGRAQARAFGCPELPIIVVPHPFGSRTRDEVRALASQCVRDITRSLADARADGPAPVEPTPSHASLDAPAEQEAFDAYCRERNWSDGLPLVPPTPRRVDRLLRGTRRDRAEVVAHVPPSFGTATVERIAVNAVMAGCDARFLPVVIAAVEAACDPAFNLQGVQTTTNPAAPWIIVNGPAADALGINAGVNCLGQGSWANATIGRALRLVLQNIGGGVPGVMDRATQGQPAKYTFCCAENEAASPWEPLHVEHGHARGVSTVTLVAAAGTLNLNSHSKDADDLIRVFADTLAHPTSNDYWYAGAPYVVIAPEHAEILHEAGLGKADLKQRLWTESKMSAARLSAKDFTRPAHVRASELGALTRETMIPITSTADGIGIIVAGGPGTHSVYVPGFGNSRAVTRVVESGTDREAAHPITPP